MLNRAPMKRSAWTTKRTAPAAKELTREQRLAARAKTAITMPAQGARENKVNRPAVHAVCAPVAINIVASFAKDVRHENRHLLDMAQGMPCLLRVPGVCNRDPDTTVAAHSNWQQHGGKGAHRKADDCYSVFGCSACHTWLDQGGTATKAEKQLAFLRAHADQVLIWRHIAADPRRPAADRKAAKWALDHLNATPNPSTDLELDTP